MEEKEKKTEESKVQKGKNKAKMKAASKCSI